MDEAEIAKALQTDLNFFRVKVQVKSKESQLHILATRNEGNDVDYTVLFENIQKILEQLRAPGIESFILYGRIVGVKQPEWQKVGEIHQIPDNEEVSNQELEEPESFMLGEGLEPLEIPDYEQTEVFESEDEQNLPPVKKTPVNYLIPIAMALIAVLIGLGWLFVWDRSSQEEKLKQAQAIAVDAKKFDPNQLGKIEALRNSQQELQQAIALLGEIPDRPASLYSEAQAQIAILQPKLAAIDKKLTFEQAAANNLESAKRVAKEASQLVQTPPLKLVALQSAQAKWQESLDLLKKIPPGTFVSQESQEKLLSYQANYAAITGKAQRQRQLDIAVAFWNRRVGSATKNDFKRIKASRVSKTEFIRSCSSRLRPGLKPVELQKDGFKPASFAATVCNYAWTAK